MELIENSVENLQYIVNLRKALESLLESSKSHCISIDVHCISSILENQFGIEICTQKMGKILSEYAQKQGWERIKLGKHSKQRYMIIW